MYPACWLVILLLSFGKDGSHGDSHIQWRFSSIEQSGSEWKLSFTAVVDRGWHLYSQSIEEGGPMPTSFQFNKGEYKLSGKTNEAGDVKKYYDSTFMMNVLWYEGQVIFSQQVKAKAKALVTGEITYSVCSEETCIPGTVRFSLDVGR